MSNQVSWFKRLRWMIRLEARSGRQHLRGIRQNMAAWPRFWKEYHEYNRQSRHDAQHSLRYLYPCLNDNTDETVIEPVYFYQDSWAFEKIVQQHPSLHVDVGSQHKFVALLSKVVPVTMVDIRPLSLPLDTLTFKKGSILEMPFETDSLPSISSICVVEHIGLGRYGDPLDPYGTEKAIAELKRVLAPGGRLYLSIPVGNENITAFNAGRIFRLSDLLKLFEPLIVLEQRFIVGDSYQTNYESRPMFGTTGLFELLKPNKE